MAKLSHYLEQSLVLLGTSVARVLSESSADRLGAFMGRGAFNLLKGRRNVALGNLRHAFPMKSEAELAPITRAVFENVGRTAVEVARFGVTTAERLKEIVVPAGREQLDRALEAGNGGIFLTAHFGNWELSACWLAAMGYPIDILVLAQHNDLFDRMLNRSRNRMGVGTMLVGQNTRDIFRALKQNKLVGIAPDQHDPSRNLIIDFFGRKAAAARGPALFSIRTGAPILPFLLRRIRHDRHEFISGDPIFPPSGGDESSQVREMVLSYHRFYEEVITRYPDQWMWTHRRWKAADD
ncbi:MAG: lysophospholipid acyltransferase family protein [bacterium]|nr:lysophospholipid acyltransferase family protein [bacterium]